MNFVFGLELFAIFVAVYSARVFYEMNMEERCESLLPVERNGRKGYKICCKFREGHSGPHEQEGLHWLDREGLKEEESE